MAISAILERPPSTSVGMGQIVLGRKPSHLTAVLGSCVGVALYHPRLQLALLAHVVLADSGGRPAAPGKFADTAIPYMVQLLEKECGRTHGVLAKLAGGACMFGAIGPMHIGQANVDAVMRALDAARIHVAQQDVGGTCGRRISLNCETGELLIESVGRPSRRL